MQAVKMKYEFRSGTTDSVLKLYIYDEICGSSENFWTGETIVSETSSDFVRQQLEQYPHVETIEVYINSVGGDVYEAYGICAQLRRHNAHKVVYIDGIAASAASIIAMCGDVIYGYSNSIVMIHEAQTGVWGNPSQLRKAATDLEKLMVGVRSLYMERSGGKLDETLVSQMLAEETWLTAEECIQYGLMDEVITGTADISKISMRLRKGNVTAIQQMTAQGKIDSRTEKSLLQNEERQAEPSPCEHITEAKQINTHAVEQMAAFFCAFHQ